jgi:hypothetical protein
MSFFFFLKKKKGRSDRHSIKRVGIELLLKYIYIYIYILLLYCFLVRLVKNKKKVKLNGVRNSNLDNL